MGNFSITAVRLGGEREKKEKPTQKQLVLQAPPAQRPARRCGAGRLGWSEECGEPSEACAAPSARGAAPVHPAPRTAFRLGRRAHAWRAPDRRAPRTARLPGDPPLPRARAPSLPGPGSAATAPRAAAARPSSPVRLQPSSARRAAAPALGIPAAAPAAVAARSSVCDAKGAGASLCCLFMRPR